ncbi:MAG: hypothetical protein JWQ08_2770 [Deinococcus sp.]|nr:hypothetical protein [Deinococcus sp.]
MKRTARVWATAALAAALWLAIGLVQRTRAGAALGDAALAEVPLSLAVFGLAVVWGLVRQGRGR